MAKILKYINYFISATYLILFIISLVFLFQIKSNSKKEPINRGGYIQTDPLNYYLEEEFCYKHYESFIDKGAFKDFDLRIKKIRKFAIILIVIFFIKMFFVIIIGILNKIEEKYNDNKMCKCFKCIILLLYLINELLLLIFFIIISVHYFNSNFDDFDKFSKCRYLGSNFKYDYDFVSVVKKKFKTFFILTIIFIIIFIVLNCFQICLVCAEKRNNRI